MVGWGGGRASPVGRLAHKGWHDKIPPPPPSAGRFSRPYLLFGLFGLRLILIKATLFRQQSAREGEKTEIERQRDRMRETGGRLIKAANVERGVREGAYADGNLKRRKSRVLFKNNNNKTM